MGNIGSVRSLKLLGGGGAVRGSEGHPAADDDLASEKSHLLAKKLTISTIELLISAVQLLISPIHLVISTIP